MKGSAYRVDIQALRGIAVLLVVFYHARALPLAGGYLGVDIFFVISGFLITSQIARQIEQNTFSFHEFYLRRVWRLLPAAYAVFAVVCLSAPWLLSANELNDLKEQLIGAITFTANIVLWTQTGYFEESAEVKPLLHTWSLSIEEQYYLIMPALLYFITKSRWFLLIAGITVISFLLMSVQISSMPGAIFYLTPARIWELGVGSTLALLVLHKEIAVPPWLGVVGIGAIATTTIFLLPFDNHTEINIAVAVIGTALIIASQPSWLNNGTIALGFAKIGTISYSLYLVHWPIFAFLNSANISGAGLWWPYRGGALIASFLLAWLLFNVIETKFRITSAAHNKTFFPLLIMSILLLVSPFILFSNTSPRDYAYEFRPIVGSSDKCSTPQFATNAQCKTGTSPKTFLWGDSFAMHLIPGLSATAHAGIVTAVKTTCAPLPNHSVYSPPKFPLIWSEGCLSQNQAALAYILENQQLELVILAAQWEYLFSGHSMAEKYNDKIHVTPVSKFKLANEIIALTRRIQSAGKKVIVVASPPTNGMNIGKCHERLENSILRIGGTSDCEFSFTDAAAHKQNSLTFYNHLRQNRVPLFSFDTLLCDANRCSTKIGDTILYRDTGHFTHASSKLLARRFQILEMMREQVGLPVEKR